MEFTTSEMTGVTTAQMQEAVENTLSGADVPIAFDSVAVAAPTQSGLKSTYVITTQYPWSTKLTMGDTLFGGKLIYMITPYFLIG